MSHSHKRTFASPASTGGFTLIELMITLAVALILFIVALPSFRELAIRNNVKELNNTLIYSLNLARTEAVRRGTPVRVVSGGGVGSASWNLGWQVVADAAFNNFASGTAIVNTQGPVPTNYSVCGSSTGGGSNGAVTFTATGILSGATSFDLNANRPDAQPLLSQRVTVQNGGQVRSQINTTGSPASANSTCT
jgi:type IV fimbrial biogenesis protein FimT